MRDLSTSFLGLFVLSTNKIISDNEFESSYIEVEKKSHIIISLYEANEITKKNSIIETFTIIPFFIFLIILIYKENVMLICYLILAKEILVFIIRSFIIKKYLISYGLYLSSISLFLITWFSKINEINELYMIAKILFFISILLLIYNAYKQIK